MTPPNRKPWFYDSTGAGGEFTFPDTGREMGWLIDRLAHTVGYFPLWRTDNDGTPPRDITLTLEEHVPDKHMRARFTCGHVTGTITAEPDPASGFVSITAEVVGHEPFRAYMDHPWEEFELFPPGDTTAQADEGPGRMSKKLWWVSLSVAAWPMLAPITSGGRFNAIVPD